MKIRSGFVSNSSSSSFIIYLSIIDSNLYEKIVNHPDNFKDSWHIRVDDGRLIGTTSGNDYEMKNYFRDIGVDESLVIWITE